MQKNKTNVSLKLQRGLTLKVTRLSATQSTLSVAYLDKTHVQVVEEQAVTSYSLPLLFTRKEKKKKKKKKRNIGCSDAEVSHQPGASASIRKALSQIAQRSRSSRSFDQIFRGSAGHQ